VTGPLVLVVGLSGSVLVFRTPLEELERGGPIVVRPRGSMASIDRIAGAALATDPAATLHALRLPDTPEAPVLVELRRGQRRLDVAVDPYTSRVLRARAPDRSVLVAVHALHAALHAGRAGGVLVGLLGLGLIVESVTGLWLCWPAARRRPLAGGGRRDGGGPDGSSWTGRPGAVHVVVGGLSVGLGVIVALTGSVLALAGGSALAGTMVTGPQPSSHRPANLDLIASRAESALPGGRITALVTGAGGATIRVDKRLAPGSAGAVIVDRATGEIVAVRVNERQTGVRELVRRLHAGDLAGWPSRVAWALVGLALPVLSITGYLLAGRRVTGRGTAGAP
jgi:uncharacterized iron-regulated membrane protein